MLAPTPIIHVKAGVWGWPDVHGKEGLPMEGRLNVISGHRSAGAIMTRGAGGAIDWLCEAARGSTTEGQGIYTYGRAAVLSAIRLPGWKVCLLRWCGV